MALKHNRAAVRRLLVKLEPSILGQTRPEWACNCGAIHHGPATAVKVEPAGDYYPGQEVAWYLWRVIMSETPQVKCSHHYSVGVEQFIPSEEIKRFFAQEFGEDPALYTPYDLQPNDHDRYLQRLAPIATAAIKPEILIVGIHFGRAQTTAAALFQIYQTSENKYIWSSDEKFGRIIDLIKNLNPKLVVGGPEPELEHEPRWSVDLREVLNLARHYRRLHFSGLGYTLKPEGGRGFYNVDITFMTPAV